MRPVNLVKSIMLSLLPVTGQIFSKIFCDLFVNVKNPIIFAAALRKKNTSFS
jgi:hypothetical protein